MSELNRRLIKESKPEGFSMIQIGRTRCGKTTFIKKHIKNICENDIYRDILILDPNCEFKEFLAEGESPIRKWEDFKPRLQNLTNTLIVIEEATIALDPRKKEGEVVDLLIKKRHDNNIIILNFHSWRSVPFYIFEFSDYVTIFKTLDSDKSQKNKCDIPKVVKAYNEVANSPNNYKFKTIDLYN